MPPAVAIVHAMQTASGREGSGHPAELMVLCDLRKYAILR
jgi:hypothetical protein